MADRNFIEIVEYSSKDVTQTQPGIRSGHSESKKRGSENENGLDLGAARKLALPERLFQAPGRCLLCFLSSALAHGLCSQHLRHLDEIVRKTIELINNVLGEQIASKTKD